VIAVFGLALAALPLAPGPIVVPYKAQAWVPDGGDAVRQAPVYADIETNGCYIRHAAPGANMAAWQTSLARVRADARSSPVPRAIAVTYRGVRAWVRCRTALGRALCLRPGERIQVALEGRSLSGNREVCLAFDYLDRATDAWRGWSTVVAAARLPTDGMWGRITLSATAPAYDAAGTWANVIVGQDATHDAAPGQWEIRSISLEAEDRPGRQASVSRALADLRDPAPITAIYDRPDMRWASTNYACLFLFLYDSEVYDRERRRYRTEEMVARWDRDFGGVDSVVLWQAYPRIGVDPRNQFDHYRDMPGGLPGLRRFIAALHRHGIRAFLAYNPWDTGTRREGIPDARAIARMVGALRADGVFLDTMAEAPPDLRREVDAVRRGVVFEPEGMPAVEQLGMCGSSWAQGLAEYPEPAVSLLKWIEPRHMQHYIRRWDRSHADEIRSAFINGNGMLIWQNIFGTWNPWSEADRAAWRRLVPVLRRFGAALRSESCEPMVGKAEGGTTVNRWPLAGADLYLFWTPQEARTTCASLGIEVGPYGGEDAINGGRLSSAAEPLEMVNGLGAVVIHRSPASAVPPRRREATGLSSTVTPAVAGDIRVQRTQPADPRRLPPGMVRVPAMTVRTKLAHERRECGCYPDPGASPDRSAYWSWGNPFHETIVHDYTVEVPEFWMDECLVTNGDYERFLQATGYRPRERANFLKHWGGRRCPPKLRDHPVVYVDLDDARAYARWAGKRLPTEPEWQAAAQGTDGRKWPWGGAFDPARCNPGGSTTPVRAYPEGRSPVGCYDMTGNVWQWTESERSDGHTRSCIIRGGSWFDAPGSIWYVHGGPQPLDTHTRLLLMHPGLDRSATIGFRCVRDAIRTAP